MKTIVRLILLMTTVLMLVGCLNKHKSESKVPWAKPASWEGGMPGIGM